MVQVSRGIYNPVTHEYKELPEPQYAGRKEKEFERAHGIGHGLRRLQPFEPCDPITWTSPERPQLEVPAASPVPPESDVSALTPEPQVASLSAAAASAPAAARQQRPASAPGRGRSLRKSMQGPSWGTYNPLTHEWQVPPADTKYAKQEEMVDRQLGVSGRSAGRTAMPRSQGVYNPILNTWTVPPADPRVVDGLSFKPATLFSRPTPATIRM
ncbi:hypothetical protein GPECTOR_1g222 [Gonium pectorale]|uniref:Uncharacterized protein n=1 Tax=Gonium pectorale TaxID=33097 RepID=A0A150H2J5_GONPE|nr:hypothetical protein GPECTOR_1g222 [Gonium pectorale]|eukprot:KXZ56255.1 hypothetical protein GPECTOR_1g222 [Gonium pectorale]